LVTGGIVVGLVSCNDGSTGCCKVCVGSCACGDNCQTCGFVCAAPKGCACTSNPTLTSSELMSEDPDAGEGQ